MRIRSPWFAVILTGATLIAGVTACAPPAASGCSASASAPWTPVAGRAFGLEAFSGGPSCTHAVVTLVVRAPDGKVLWSDAAPADRLMIFVDVKTQEQMTRALQEWLSQSQTFKSTGDLPEWKTGAEAPVYGEFPFYPEAGVDRETYERTRAERQPVFCYVQGMESMSCLGLSKEGTLSKIGVQSFPG